MTNTTMKTYQLTQHFALNEFTRSATAIANGIDNSLDLAKADDRKVAENLQYLCQTVLEPLREHFGMPVVISSGYRCKELNRVVGGVRNSQHLTGEAADIQPLAPVSAGFACSSSLPLSETLKQWFHFIQDNCRFDQLILETQGGRQWIHVSTCRNDSRNRQACLTLKR